MKKLTLEDLLNRKLSEGFQSKEVEVKTLGGTLTIVKQPLPTVLRIVENMENASGLTEQLSIFTDLIYKCTPILHDKQLQDKYGCAEPTDIVLKILNDNFDEITHIGTAILEFYGDSFNGFSENLKKQSETIQN
ncbi:hypothetical protein [Veillonella sp.]|uniref:hypothetical protein n=1 Tax=Veillonella sp. TaxID=1926307 RepID=UPI0020673695|nr:hypothetical protein [Veillonella sp.]DAZ24044.1 MAG TPA: tail assembly chaperone protein [Caudoviricetes sp.]